MLEFTGMFAGVRGLEELVVRQGVGQVDGLEGFPEAPAEQRVVVDVHVVDVLRVIDLRNLTITVVD